MPPPGRGDDGLDDLHHLRELRARRAALLLPFSQALEVEKRYRRESLPEAVVDLLDAVTRGFYDASAALREARLAAASSVDPPRHARDSGVVLVGSNPAEVRKLSREVAV